VVRLGDVAGGPTAVSMPDPMLNESAAVAPLPPADFDFELPAELIAQTPAERRDGSRLLTLSRDDGAIGHHAITDLPALLAAGDLLVFNDTRVLPARLYGRKESGGAVEILIERIIGAHEARAQLGVSKKPKAGGRIVLDDDSAVTVVGRDGEFFLLRFEAVEPLEKLLVKLGRMPLPPYIHRDADVVDTERYQTVYARETGAVAAPTAGLHFDKPLLDALAARGIDSAYVTLHVGAGTFLPMKAEDTNDHVMHAEWGELTDAVVHRLAAAKAKGGRIVAVGTTSLRLLETAARATGELKPFIGETDIFITPGFQFRAVDVLMTNFHLPKSTLFMLVSAFAGLETMQAAYAHAIRLRYRFYSYGDASLLFRAPQAQDDRSA